MRALPISGLFCVGVLVFLLTASVKDSFGAAQLGEVKCFLAVNFSDTFDNAHGICRQRERERREKEKEGGKPPPPPPPFPINATIEDFVFDDKCRQQCIYEEAGIVKKGGGLPDKKDTETLLSKGKVSDERYQVVVSVWNDCIDLSEKVGKAKKLDNCHVATHHDHCFNHKMYEAIRGTEIPC